MLIFRCNQIWQTVKVLKLGLDIVNMGQLFFKLTNRIFNSSSTKLKKTHIE